MRRLGSSLTALRSERGFTLIELLVAMVLGVVVTGIAFSFLEFTTSDVSRTTDRVQADQAGRVALENIVLQLHSACVAPKITPIRTGSTENTLKFVSEISPVNTSGEPVSELSTVRLREIIYTPASGNKEGTLVEKSWPSSGTDPNYTFNEAATPTEKKLLSDVVQSETTNPTTKAQEPVHVFRYYRYYHTGDTGVILGQLDPNPLAVPLTPEEAKETAKVTVDFAVAPSLKENATIGKEKPIELEDSVILRLAPSSEESSNPNVPCSPET
jgi:prepilin-type N-terminal cleavage/methylation domain-containing protein